ncbi:MAG: hypothetical protein AAB513_01605 [Patescibacteria group bacterium]
MKNTYKNNISGATLFEIIITVAILALVINVVAAFSADVFRFSGTIYNSVQAQQDARNILRQLAFELRTTSPSNIGAYALAETSANRIRFYSDIDGDGLKEEVIYFLSADGRTLYKNIRKPSGAPLQYTGSFSTSTIANDIVNGATPLFTYYDTNYDGTSAPLTQPVNILSVRLVRIEVIIERDPNRAPIPINVSTQVSLRNLKDNL